MRQWLNKLKSPWSAAGSQPTPGKYHRHILLLSLAAGGAEKMLARWFESTAGETKVLHSDSWNETVTDGSHSDDTTVSQVASQIVRATYVDIRSNRRLRRWLIETLHPGVGASHPQNESISRADTCIICCPYENIGLSSADLQKRIDQILSTISIFRSRGRLRRVALVIWGIPAEDGLWHSSQQRLQVTGSNGFAVELRTLITSADRCPGHPLSDPRWRSFLTDKVLMTHGLLKLVETCRTALRQECPLFCSPRNSSSSVNDLPVLQWISKNTRPTRYLSPRFPLAALFVASVALAVATISWIVAPRVLDVKSHFPTQPEQGSVAINNELDFYRSWLTGYALPRAEISERTRQLQLAGDVITTVGELTALHRTRDSIAKSLSNPSLPSLGLVVDSARSVLLPRLTRILSTQIEQEFKAKTRLAAFPVEFSLRLMTLASMGFNQRERYDSAIHSSWLTDTTVVAPDSGDSRVYASSPVQFYLRLLELADRKEPLPIAGLHARTMIWTGFAESLLTVVPRLDISTVVADRYEDLIESARKHGLFATKDLAAVNRLLQSIRDISAPHPMVISFKVPGDQSFHVDVSQSPDGPWRPCQWMGDVCSAQLASAHIGDEFYLICNAEEAIHVTTGKMGMPCVRQQPTRFKLSDRRGRVRFDSVNIEVQFEIKDGWPEWSPNTNGGS